MSMNNTLSGARQISIRACIDRTYNKIVKYLRKHCDIAMNCNTPLSSCMCRLFVKPRHLLKELYFIRVRLQWKFLQNCHQITVNETEGNTHTVSYFQNMCICGKWQIERFLCSHVVAVCRLRWDNPLFILDTTYTTITYKQQYNYDISPLSHVD